LNPEIESLGPNATFEYFLKIFFCSEEQELEGTSKGAETSTRAGKLLLKVII
jgi:hypothetical protein